jgi:hypothetical protein
MERPGIFCARAQAHALTGKHEEQLSEGLRRITGCARLRFARDGSLQLRETGLADGAPTARAILGRALRSRMMFLVEDHSGSETVGFGQLDQGTRIDWGPKDDRESLVVWRVRLDFEDFEHVDASAEVRAAFDPAFALLHELLHGLGYRDGGDAQELGEIEGMLNSVREELGLPQREQYRAEVLPIVRGHFVVRLPFRKSSSAAAPAEARRQYLSFGCEAGRGAPSDILSLRSARR